MRGEAGTTNRKKNEPRSKQPKAGEMVVLEKIPAGLLDGLPTEDRVAISSIVGKAVLLSGYDDVGRAELEFTDGHEVIHFIYVDPSVIAKVK